MDKIIWYVKQLLPFSYWTIYEKDAKRYFCIWKMWFGRCFDVIEFEI